MRDAFGTPRSLLVLGGTSDIAVATARALVARGTRCVVLAGRDPERMAGFADELGRAGAAVAEVLEFDALLTDDHAALLEQVTARHGDIDAAIVAFGVYGDQRRAASDGAAARRVIDTNLTGAVSIATPLVQRMREQGHGNVIVLSSVAGERPRQTEFVYAASKAGLDAYFLGLADSLRGTGVNVILVRPGFVATKMNAGRRPKPWSVEPDDVARAILRGLDRQSRVVYVPAGLRYAAALVRHLPHPIFRALTAAAARRGLD